MATSDAIPIQLSLCFAALALLAWLGQTVRIKRQQSAFIKAHGCKPATSTSIRSPIFYGLDFMLENAYNIMTHKFALGVRQRFQKYGVTHTSRILHRKIVNTIDPRNLETVMKTNFEDYTIIPGRKKLIQVLFGNGVFSSEYDDWRHSRVLVRASVLRFAFDVNKFEKHTRLMLDEMRSHNGEPLDFGQLIFGYTFRLSADVLLDQPVGTAEERDLHEQFIQDFTFLGRMARVLTIMISQIPFLAELAYGVNFKRAQRRVFSQVDQRIEDTMRSRRSDELKAPGSATKNGSSLIDGFLSRSHDTARIRGELLNLLLAGHDTVGIALSELFYCLARSPCSWAALRKEVDQTLQGRLPSQADLKGMTYLQWTIKEAIRVRPTLSVHGRRAVRNTVLPRGGGVSGDEPLFVSAGTYIVYSNYALYRTASVFGSDVDTFRPERWAEAKPATFEYLNFGAGPRYCPGKEIGWSMLAYATVRLAQEFTNLRPEDDRPWEEAKAFSFYNRHGVHLSAT